MTFEVKVSRARLFQVRSDNPKAPKFRVKIDLTREFLKELAQDKTAPHFKLEAGLWDEVSKNGNEYFSGKIQVAEERPDDKVPF